MVYKDLRNPEKQLTIRKVDLTISLGVSEGIEELRNDHDDFFRVMKERAGVQEGFSKDRGRNQVTYDGESINAENIDLLKEIVADNEKQPD